MLYVAGNEFLAAEVSRIDPIQKKKRKLISEKL